MNLSSTPALVQEINDSEVINIYPQPAIDNLNIDIKLSNNYVSRLDLYDIQGKLLLSTVVDQNSNNINLDVSGLNSGIYFVKLQSKNNLYTKKVQIIK